MRETSEPILLQVELNSVASGRMKIEGSDSAFWNSKGAPTIFYIPDNFEC